jgi:anthranilate/para-aminobenzoate synthase component II
MTEKILILDFGSQYTQLIARAVREASVYCEIIPYNKAITYEPGLKGIILGGSPFSVNEEKALNADIKAMVDKVPVLGICYGAQLTAKIYGGRVDKSEKREYGRAIFTKLKEDLVSDNISGNYDLIYFDAFGPDKQPEMWTEAILRKISAITVTDGILVTYSAKGEVRRNLKASGFEVELLPGPPGKRQVIRAIKI